MLNFQPYADGGGLFWPACINEFPPSPQDIGAVAKAWEDSPYLFIVKVQPLLRGVEEDDVGAEQLGFAFASESPFLSELCGEPSLRQT